MLLARVEGNVVATRKHPSFDGWRLLICQPINHAAIPKARRKWPLTPRRGYAPARHHFLGRLGGAQRGGQTTKAPRVGWSSALWMKRNPVSAYEDWIRHRPGYFERTLARIARRALARMSAVYARALPARPETPPGMSKDPSWWFMTILAGGVGQTIGYVEGREAAQPFAQPTPMDAINAALVDEIFYDPFNI